MNYKLFFLLVALDSICLIISFINKNMIISFICFLLALYLQKASSKISFPKTTILGIDLSNIKKNNEQ